MANNDFVKKSDFRELKHKVKEQEGALYSLTSLVAKLSENLGNISNDFSEIKTSLQNLLSRKNFFDGVFKTVGWIMSGFGTLITILIALDKSGVIKAAHDFFNP